MPGLRNGSWVALLAIAASSASYASVMGASQVEFRQVYSLGPNGRVTIQNQYGNVSIMGTSHVEGGLLVEKPNSMLFNSEDPVIVIGPGAVVQGDLSFERKVKLYVSDKATIGTVTGATPITFSGDNPPN